MMAGGVRLEDDNVTDKSFAKGLSQMDFEREFMRRHPKSDVVPNVVEWLAGTPWAFPEPPKPVATQEAEAPTEQPEENTVPMGAPPVHQAAQEPSVEQPVVNDPPAAPEVVKTSPTAPPVEESPPAPTEEPEKEPAHLKLQGQYPCRGCGRIFSYPIARSGHEKHCKEALNSTGGGNTT
jgi:hypothetical protein